MTGDEGGGTYHDEDAVEVRNCGFSWGGHVVCWIPVSGSVCLLISKSYMAFAVGGIM